MIKLANVQERNQRQNTIKVPLELAAEKEAVSRLVKEWKGTKEGAEDDDDIDIYMRERKDEEEELREAMEAGKEATVFARVKVPTQVKFEC